MGSVTEPCCGGDDERIGCGYPFFNPLQDDAMLPRLSERQIEVVRLLSLGCTVKEAAAILRLSPSTVDNHKSAAMARFGTDKLALLTRLAIQYKITSMKDRLTPTEKRRSGRSDDGWN